MKVGSAFRILITFIASAFFAACDKPAPQATESTPSPKATPTAQPEKPATKVAPKDEKPVAPAATTPEKKTVRFVSWNLQWFPGHKPEATPEVAASHMAAAKSALAELKPDVALLQEVRTWGAAAELCQAVPGLTPHVVTAFDQLIPNGRPQNQVVAAKMVADSSWSAKWVGGNYGPPRGYAFAALDAGGGRFVLCWSLHLKSNLGDLNDNIKMRAESARQLITHIREMLDIYGKRGPCAVVVAGDMNTSIDDPKFAGDPTIKGLMDAGLWWTHAGVPFANRTTIPGEGGFSDNCFDHILTSGLGKPVALVKQYRGLSDHNPVIVDIDLSQADFKAAINVEAGLKALAAIPAPVVPSDLPGTLSASDDAAIRAAIGKIATVRGKVSQVGATKTGSMTFINFEGAKRGEFVAIVKKDSLAAVSESFGGDAKSLEGKTVEVKGELILYKETPEIELRTKSDIRVVE